MYFGSAQGVVERVINVRYYYYYYYYVSVCQAQTVGDQKLPTVHAVSVEEGTKVGGKRCCGQRRCKKLIIGMIIGAVVAVAITVTIFVVHRQMLGQHVSTAVHRFGG